MRRSIMSLVTSVSWMLPNTTSILTQFKVPYYCTAWSNIASKNNAIKCGYKTSWVEMAAKDIVDAMNMLGESTT